MSIASIFNSVIGFLPGSPFQRYISAIADVPYLDVVNWFFPIGEIIVIMQAWVFAISLYYLYSVVLRTIHVIS